MYVCVLKKSQLENTYQKVSTQTQNHKLFSHKMRYKHYEEQPVRVYSGVHRGFFQIETKRQYWKMNEKESPLKCFLIHSGLSSALYTHGLDLGNCLGFFSHASNAMDCISVFR